MADSDPNVGVGTEIVGGVASSSSFAEPVPYTLLSLPRYAKILGINPVHFQGAYGNTVWTMQSGCSDIWTAKAFQSSDAVSRYDLARAILSAEEDIALALGYHPAPKWTSREMHKFPQHYRNELLSGGGYQFDTKSARKSLRAKWNKVIGGGRRAVTLIDTPTLAGGGIVYSDADGDGFYETATITATTTVTDECELKVYIAGKGGEQGWEVREPKSKSVAGGVVTFVYNSWNMIDPDKQETYPTDAGYTGLCIDTITNFLTSVDVYREYTDLTAVAAQMFWEPSDCTTCTNCSLTIQGNSILPASGTNATSSCPSCGFTAQNGCLLVRDVDTGAVIPAPATYSETTGTFQVQRYAVARDPDQVKIWYQSGYISEARLRGASCEPLSDFYAEMIAWVATSRIERPFCGCGNLLTVAETLRERPTSREIRETVDFGMLSNPIGTRRGEIMAWNRISKLGKRSIDGYAI